MPFYVAITRNVNVANASYLSKFRAVQYAIEQGSATFLKLRATSWH